MTARKAIRASPGPVGLDRRPDRVVRSASDAEAGAGAASLVSGPLVLATLVCLVRRLRVSVARQEPAVDLEPVGPHRIVVEGVPRERVDARPVPRDAQSVTEPAGRG